MITMVDTRPHESWTHNWTASFCCVSYVWSVWR